MQSRVTVRDLPVMRPLLPRADALMPYLEMIDTARVYSNWGPLTDALKKRLASYFEVTPDCVTVLANGTLALQGAVQTIGHEGDLWSVPSWSFVASALAVAASGRRIHLVDVDPVTWAVPGPAGVECAGQMVVAPFGERPELSRWRDQPTPTLFDAASCFDACKGIGPHLGAKTAVMIDLRHEVRR